MQTLIHESKILWLFVFTMIITNNFLGKNKVALLYGKKIRKGMHGGLSSHC